MPEKEKIANLDVGPLLEGLLLLARIPVESFRDAMHPVLAPSPLREYVSKWIP